MKKIIMIGKVKAKKRGYQGDKNKPKKFNILDEISNPTNYNKKDFIKVDKPNFEARRTGDDRHFYEKKRR